AEDGIRDGHVTGVQTCALPIFGQLLELSHEIGMAALVEIHDEAELDRALKAGAKIIGVNNRDLRTLDVDIETSFRLRPRIPPGEIGRASCRERVESAGVRGRR